MYKYVYSSHHIFLAKKLHNGNSTQKTLPKTSKCFILKKKSYRYTLHI